MFVDDACTPLPIAISIFCLISIPTIKFTVEVQNRIFFLDADITYHSVVACHQLLYKTAVAKTRFTQEYVVHLYKRRKKEKTRNVLKTNGHSGYVISKK